MLRLRTEVVSIDDIRPQNSGIRCPSGCAIRVPYWDHPRTQEGTDAQERGDWMVIQAQIERGVY